MSSGPDPTLLLNFIIPFPLQSPSRFPLALRENPGCVPVHMTLLSLSVSQASSTPCPCCSHHMALGSLHKTSRTSHLGALPCSSLCLEVSLGTKQKIPSQLRDPSLITPPPMHVFPCFLSPQHSHFCPLWCCFSSCKPAWPNLEVNNLPGLAARG